MLVSAVTAPLLTVNLTLRVSLNGALRWCRRDLSCPHRRCCLSCEGTLGPLCSSLWWGDSAGPARLRSVLTVCWQRASDPRLPWQFLWLLSQGAAPAQPEQYDCSSAHSCSCQVSCLQA